MREEDEDLQSWGWTDLSGYSSSTSDSDRESGVMSRRSLRLDDGLLDRSLPHNSASFSVGGAGWRSSRSVKSRHSQRHSASCSESLLLRTPRRPAGPSLHDCSLHSVTSDASLISSLLDESSIQENTLVDTFWGLDDDVDPKESTVLAEERSVVVTGSRTASDSRCTKHPSQTVSRVYCEDCRTPGPSSSRETETTIYCREKGCRSTTDVLQQRLTSSVLCVRSAAARCVSALSHTWQVCRRAPVGTQSVGRAARSGCSGAMSSKETSPKELLPKGSLCDDCKEKQRSQTDPASSWSSLAAGLLELTCTAAVVAGSATWFLLQLCVGAAEALQPLIRTCFTTSLRHGRSAGRAAGDAFRWLCRRWRHMTTSSHLRRFLLGLFTVVLPLLLILSLSWFGPDGFQSVLPAINITAWRTAISEAPAMSSVHSVLSSQSQPAEGAVEESPPRPPETTAQEVTAADDYDRLERVEQSVTVLWQRVEARGRRVEQKHREVLRLHADLLQQQQLSSSQSEEPWVSSLVEQHLSQLRRRLDEDRQQRDEIRQQDLMHQSRQTSRLDQLELQLQELSSRTKEVQLMQEASVSSATLPAAVGVGVDRLSHDALLEEISRLETALGDVRRDVDGLSSCRDGCRGLDRIQRTLSDQVSAQIRDEVRVLVYGDQLASPDGDVSVQESLLRRLSERFVSVDDLQAALVSLEIRILQNIRLQRRRDETVLGDDPGTAMSREEVQEMLTEALRLFSEDRTGLADYALESGGGSILSTRCSETYETKAALLSLFGVPLWYFSQSPRAVIQPDVHPGNCWAFRGSTGFLVIRLSMRILPTAFTLEHIPRALAPSRMLLSAPRDLSVYGLDADGQERRKLLATLSYDQDGDALQTFPASEENDEPFQIIEVQVLSNWGHPEYTCMYRFRVHGTPREA